MGIYIPKMEMPNSCYDCVMECNNICSCMEARVESADRHPSCPLIEVKPHGRLIDADALYDELEDYYKNRQGLERRGIRHCIDLVTEYAPTIIESEGEE